MTAWDDIRFEWERGPFRLSTEDSLVVMARIAELEAAGDLTEHLVRAAEQIVALEAENQALRNQAGNAVGAIIDSGGYCEGPHHGTGGAGPVTVRLPLPAAPEEPTK